MAQERREKDVGLVPEGLRARQWRACYSRSQALFFSGGCMPKLSDIVQYVNICVGILHLQASA